MTLVTVLFVSGSALDAPVAKASGPAIRVDPDGFDFGRARPHRGLRKTFTLRNAGDQDLILRRPRTSCGCTVAELSASRLEPGCSTPLTVTLSTGRSRGPIEKSVVVPSNDPKTPLLEIKLRAVVVASEEE